MTDCTTCPEPSNLGDVALQLQHTALQAEACIFDLERLLRSAVNRPTWVSVTTAANQMSNTGTSFVELSMGVAQTVLFNNTSWSIPEFLFIDGGVFLMGAYINPTAVGVADNNTIRVLRLGTGTGNFSSNAAYYTAYETTTAGGNDMTISAVFDVQPGETGSFTFLHNNTSSDLTIPAGALFWVTRLGDTLALKTV